MITNEMVVHSTCIGLGFNETWVHYIRKEQDLLHTGVVSLDVRQANCLKTKRFVVVAVLWIEGNSLNKMNYLSSRTATGLPRENLKRGSDSLVYGNNILVPAASQHKNK